MFTLCTTRATGSSTLDLAGLLRNRSTRAAGLGLGTQGRNNWRQYSHGPHANFLDCTPNFLFEI